MISGNSWLHTIMRGSISSFSDNVQRKIMDYVELLKGENRFVKMYFHLHLVLRSSMRFYSVLRLIRLLYLKMS